MGGSNLAQVSLAGVSPPAGSGYGYYYYNEIAVTGSSFNNGSTYYWASGYNNSQFVLTEAPAVSSATSALSRDAAAPTTCGVSFTTRMLMGYLGYIGQISPSLANSVNYVLTGELEGTSGLNSIANSNYGGTSMPFSTSGPRTGSMFNYSLLNAIQEYSPSTMPTALQFNIFEPTLSCGSTNGLTTSWTNINTSTSNYYSGPQYKFSMLGRIF